MWGWDIAVAAGAAFATAGVGGAATKLDSWYYDLKKPGLQPPDWLFPVAWTTIFALIAWAGVLAWRGAEGLPGARTLVLAAFGANAVLNMAWSVLFFTLKRPDWALIEVVVFWLSIVALILVAGRYDPLAPWLLAPYLVWVSFATWLNWAIARLNRPFGGRAEEARGTAG